MSPLRIGTTEIGAFNSDGQRLAIYIGDTLIDAGVVVPSFMDFEQVIQLPHSSYTALGPGGQPPFIHRWTIETNRPAIINGLKENDSDQRFFHQLQVDVFGARDPLQITGMGLSIAQSSSGDDTSRNDLSRTFEFENQLLLKKGTNTITASFSSEDARDEDEPYFLNTVTNPIIGDGRSFISALNTSSDKSITFTIRTPFGIAQTLDLPSTSYSKVSGNIIWDVNIDIKRGIRSADNTAFDRLRIFSSASSGIELDFINGELYSGFETGGSVTIESGGSTLSFNTSSYNDTSEPYVYRNVPGHAAFFNAVNGRSGNQSGTITIRDYEV